MTSAIGVAKTIIANRPVASDAPQAHSQGFLGFRPCHPKIQKLLTIYQLKRKFVYCLLFFCVRFRSSLPALLADSILIACGAAAEDPVVKELGEA